MNLKYTFIIVIFFNFSCSSISNKRLYLNDYYCVTNQLIDEASKTRDSVYLFDRFSTESKEKRNFFYLFYYMEKVDKKGKLYANNFKKFLALNGINYENEENYFKEQFSKNIDINLERIIFKKVKIYPMSKRNIDKYLLRSEYSEYNQNFAINLFPYSHPVFTKNGKYAIASYGREHKHYFVIFKKIDKKWKQIDKYNSSRITIID